MTRDRALRGDPRVSPTGLALLWIGAVALLAGLAPVALATGDASPLSWASVLAGAALALSGGSLVVVDLVFGRPVPAQRPLPPARARRSGARAR